MDLRWVLVAGVLLSAAFAGCGGKASAPEPSEDLSGTHGTVVGLITDDEARPMDGAEVALKTIKVSPISIKILTNTEGRFRLEKVPAGKQTVIVDKEGYDEGSTTITVVPGAETNVRIVLRATPIKEYRIEPLAIMSGQYICAWENTQTAGECDFEAKNNTGGAADPIPNEDNNHTFEVPSNWGGILIQVRWTVGQPVPTIQGIRFQMESQEDLGGQFVKADALESPMRIELRAGIVAPDATLGYPVPQRGVATWLTVLPLGYGEGSTCAVDCMGGVGAGVQIDYDIAVTVFYGGPVDPTYDAFVNG